MALDPEDLKALDARIAGARRFGAVGAIDAVAAVFEAGVSGPVAAQILREHAGDIMQGRVMPGDQVRLALVADDVVDAEVEEERAPAQGVQAIEVGEPVGGNATLRPLGAEEFDAGMVAWLDLFDDRIRSSHHFVTAVNEAAAAGRLADETTARLVAERVAELAPRTPAEWEDDDDGAAKREGRTGGMRARPREG